ncbi:hypothetical protein [Desulfotomaculum copahuensis]|uniref:hypothetical protein n=1 Tax=Desulfotomaculum copahuensis TaxID=1838280 RepID=UPI0013735D2F|nr:hypothetical protein [Desulfotomaculum copahuensis]
MAATLHSESMPPVPGSPDEIDGQPVGCLNTLQIAAKVTPPPAKRVSSTLIFEMPAD